MGLFGGGQSKYDENRRKAMEAYQQYMEGLGGGLESAYAPTSDEQANVIRRYNLAGQVGGPGQLYTELDPELAGLYRQQAIDLLQSPDKYYQESVGDMMKMLGEYSGGQAVGRGVFGSGLHAQDYAQRALQTMVPYRLQEITNSLNRGENLINTLEGLRRTAVGEYEPVRQRQVTGADRYAQYAAQGAGARYGTEADIAGERAKAYSGQRSAIGGALTNVGTTILDAYMPGAGKAARAATGSGGTPSAYGGYDSLQGLSGDQMESYYRQAARARNPYGVGG